MKKELIKIFLLLILTVSTLSPEAHAALWEGGARRGATIVARIAPHILSRAASFWPGERATPAAHRAKAIRDLMKRSTSNQPKGEGGPTLGLFSVKDDRLNVAFKYAGSKEWSLPVEICSEVKAKGTPSATTFRGKLRVSVAGEEGEVHLLSSPDGVAWRSSLIPGLYGSTTIAAYMGGLHAAARGPSGIVLTCSSDGETWERPKQIPGGMGNPILSATSKPHRLFLWQREDDVLDYRVFRDGGFQTFRLDSHPLLSDPALCGNLVAYAGRFGNERIITIGDRSKGYVRVKPLQILFGDGSINFAYSGSDAPALAQHEKMTHLVYTDFMGHIHCCYSEDGVNWKGDLLPGHTSDYGVALAVFSPYTLRSQ